MGRVGSVHFHALKRGSGHEQPNFLGANVSWQSGLPFITLDGWPVIPETTPFLKLQLDAKRLIDIALSCSLVVFFLPLCLVVAFGIWWTSPGGVFFRQVRQGLDGRQFEILKFRTLYLACCDKSGLEQTVEDDPRITPIGKVIRRTNIDELPQLLNVLRGDMSLVGPRPHVLGMRAGGLSYEELVPYYDARHKCMRPGLSGWAQANGLRGSTDDPHLARRRIDHDLAYIQNYSLWLDIKIIAKTLLREAAGGSGR